MKLTTVAYQSALAVYAVLPFKKQICHLLRWLPISNEKFYLDLKFNGSFAVQVDGKKFLLMHSGQTIENEIFWKGISGGWEKNSLRLWKALCEDAAVVMDIGANTGIYALVAACVNPAADVFAFEPSLKMFAKLNENIVLNGFANIRSLPLAVSDKNGEGIFYDFAGNHQYSASLNKDMPVGDIEKTEVKVPLIALDALIDQEQLKRVDLLKIDVEMHEPEVISGSQQQLRKFMPSMIIEILSAEIGERIERQLEGLNYLYFDIDEMNGPRQTLHLTKSSSYNFLICSEAAAKKLHLI